MGSDNDNDSATAEGTVIDQERAEYHLRCLGVDCGWRAGEVEYFIKYREAAMNAVCAEVGTRGATIMQQAARISALESTERELREAVRVLAAEVVAIEKLLAAGTPVMKPVGYFLAASVLSNPIAAAAVREAGR